jgi:epoxyqueuosine reductase
VLTSAAIKAHAHGLGFDAVGIAPARTFPELARLREWLDRGSAGEMRYLEKSAETRADIRRFLPSARAVIVTGSVYYTPPRESDASSAKPGTVGDASPSSRSQPARIARYAWGDDYHDVLQHRLEALVGWMQEQAPEPFEARIFVDKHHVQERVFAKHAGLGWIGKNTCLIHPEQGSWVFLAGVAVSLDLDCDASQPDQCGACTLCLDACPTGALVDEYDLDATRCISYLTIEHKGPIPVERRAQLGDHVFGCDICQEVCPYNLAPLGTLDPAWQPRQERDTVRAADLWTLSDAELHARVRGSAMTRASLSRLRRNLAVVLGNSDDPHDREVLDLPGRGVRRAAQSAETPLVHEHVEWARRQQSDAAAAEGEGTLAGEAAVQKVN